MRPLIPEPYRVLVFLAGVGLWLLLVIAAFAAYGLLGGPAWIAIVFALLPMLVVILAWATLGLSRASMLRILAIGAILSALVYLLFTRGLVR